MKTIAVLTTSRADWGHLRFVLEEIRAHPELKLHLIATAAHLSPEFGLTLREIRSDGFEPDHLIECLISSDRDVGMAKTIGLLTLGLADHLASLRPDIFLLIADRYEMLAPAAVALALRIPVAHIEGGEVSMGAIDDAVRHALSKLSHLHFVPTELAARRLLALGEEPARIHVTGAPSLDQLRRAALLDRPALERALGFALVPAPVIVAYHPVTLDLNPLAEVEAVFEALASLDHPIVFCFPNADAGSRDLIQRAKELAAARPRVHLAINLAPHLYWSLLQAAAALVGNSSSGIMEAASLALPTVNIGARQAGRQRAAHVLDVPGEPLALRQAFARALDPSSRQRLAGLVNPYGDGHTSPRIAALLAAAPPREVLLAKPALAPHPQSLDEASHGIS